MSKLILKVVTPEGTHGPFECDSVRLNASDNAGGRGGGSCGIRPGHIASLIALEKGMLTAFLNGAKVISASCGGGFASIDNNTVTVVTEEYAEQK